MKIEFTQEMLDKLHNAIEETAGTNEYTKYYMSVFSGRTFLGANAHPFGTGYIQKSKGRNPQWCIYTPNSDGVWRYVLTEDVIELLGLKL